MVSASRLMALSASIRVALAAGIGNMDNLVTFGDSYTDESRATYLAEYGHVPPAGLLMPPNNRTADGGIAWGRMVANMTGASYYNYAVAGSTCSEKVATQPARIIPGQIPTVLEYEVPAFEADLAVASFYHNRQPNNTVYAMWIGTNDLGIEGFLHDRNRPGTVLNDFVGCVWESFDRIYKTGGRRFVVMKAVPLEKAPTYASFDNGGARDNPVWPTKSQYNTTEYQHKMFQYSQAVNELLDYTTPFHLLLKRRWPGASVTVFDTHSIFNDIHDNPGQYLSSPQNVVSSFKTCDATGKCESSTWPRSSFLCASQDYTLVLGAEDDAVAEVKGKARKGAQELSSPRHWRRQAAAKPFSAFRSCQRQPDLCSLNTPPPADHRYKGGGRIAENKSCSHLRTSQPFGCLLFVVDSSATIILVILPTLTRAPAQNFHPPIYSVLGPSTAPPRRSLPTRTSCRIQPQPRGKSSRPYFCCTPAPRLAMFQGQFGYGNAGPQFNNQQAGAQPNQQQQQQMMFNPQQFAGMAPQPGFNPAANPQMMAGASQGMMQNPAMPNMAANGPSELLSCLC
ncbi:hypothetical protein G3M48_007872 [Beauveria asiatica]|uniref:Acetyl esterase n=1 Tax=Beauveria asiatica TaxID=1069075 RepID=A0AAW0RM68_9HYPO